MAPGDKQHKKRLKEAEKTYSKSMKAFQQGKISKDELKERLRPYKYELKELGYPVKIKDDDRPKEETTIKEEAKTPTKITYTSWKKRSSLTMEEIEDRIDTLSFGGKPSDSLRKLYQEKYGEDLMPPENLLPFEPVKEELPTRRVRGALPAADEEQDTVLRGNEETEKKPFWKSIFKGNRKEEQELEGSE